MPHRAFDATLRESELDGVKWEKTDFAKAIGAARPDHAYALLRFDPGMVLLGGWDSTKLGKRAQATREAKYPAALSCEITATDVLPVSRAGSRIDPLGIEGTEPSLVEHEDGTLEPYDEATHGELKIRGEKETDEYPRRVKPSQVNLGNVAPGLIPKGVLVRGEITLNGVLDLRRLCGYKFAPADDTEARLLLALMGLYGVDAVVRRGLDLRRDCELIASEFAVSILRFAAEPEPLDLTDVGDALATQIAALKDHIADPVTLTANAALRSLVGAQ
jgi:CRISPR-associated protein Csb1